MLHFSRGPALWRPAQVVDKFVDKEGAAVIFAFFVDNSVDKPEVPAAIRKSGVA
jgi:hypothetical protein